MSYYTTTFCFGEKYNQIKNKWIERIQNRCKNNLISVFDKCNIKLKYGDDYAWWDLVRLYNNINILLKTEKPVVNIDIDLIIEKNIEPIVDLNYDFIISTEIGFNNAFPKECSKILGFGVCSGFYVIKQSALKFVSKLYNSMYNRLYNSYSDQVTLMNYIVNNKYTVTEEGIELDGVKYINKIIKIDDIKICVLDFNIIVRDPISNNGQFGNHINIDNVGGTVNFLKYFDEDLEKLPLTCRCGKKHLGDNTICKHSDIRKYSFSNK
jgi:hypothetical protein